MGIDVWEVIDAAATKPFGFMPFYPGPGLGGHCIPIDPFYLTWKAREFGLTTRFIELAGEINIGDAASTWSTGWPRRSTSDGKPLKGAKVLVLGWRTRSDVDDVRESPAFAVIELLQERGAEVSYHDPFVPRARPMRNHDLATWPRWRSTTRRSPASDAVVIVTDHTGIDYARVVARRRWWWTRAGRPGGSRGGRGLCRA